MLPGSEIRQRVRDGLATGKLWPLARDGGKLDPATRDAVCRICDRPIPAGQAYTVSRPSATVLAHLECYLFWLYASGLLPAEPITCSACRRLIPPHAERTMVGGAPYHRWCWDRGGWPPDGPRGR